MRPLVPPDKTVETFPQFWFCKTVTIMITLVEVARKMKVIEGMKPVPNTLNALLISLTWPARMMIIADLS